VVEATKAYEATFTASESRAVEMYDFANKPDTPAGRRMKEIDDSLAETVDPLFSDPNKPLIIAQMVAKEMLIAPRKKGTPAAPAKPAAVAPAQPKKQILPAGGSRTAPVPVQSNQEETEIQGLRTRLDLRRFAEKRGLKLAGL
jgi:hypothetical protein